MKKIIYSMTAIFAFFIINFCFVSKVDAASTVNFNGDTYTVNESNEYNSTNKVNWITISSDRIPEARISLEIDLNLIKEYNSSNGIISYEVLKQWVNNLELALDYFYELNLNPVDKSLVIELTGVSNQYASAYASSANNRIVMKKSYHSWFSLPGMQAAYENGFVDINGTILHEMGHVFTKMVGYSNISNTPWNFNSETINLMMVKYVADRLIENNPKISLSVIYTGRHYYSADQTKNPEIYNYFSNINTQLDKKGDNNKYYVHSNYSDAFKKQIELDPFVNGANYVYLIYNTTKMLDIAGKDATKNTFNEYFKEDIKNYNTSDNFNKYCTFAEILKKYSTTEAWEEMAPNHDALYNYFVLNVNINENPLIVAKGKSKQVSIGITNIGAYDTIEPTYTMFDVYDDKTEELYNGSRKYAKDSATVDNFGVVTGKEITQDKNAAVVIKLGSRYEILPIKVTEPATDLNLNISNFAITDINQTVSVNATVLPSVAEQTVKWSSSDEKVATVDANGLIKPVGNGECKITATTTDGTNLSKSVDISVDIDEGVPLKDITITGDNEILKNQVKRLTVAYAPVDTTDDKTVKWESSDTNVLTVDANGQIKGIKEGTATVTATVGNISNTKEITVIEVHLTAFSYTIPLNNGKIQKNQTTKIKLTYEPENITDDIIKEFSSSNPDVLTVDSEGNIKGIKEGTATISITVNGITKNVDINVEEIHVNSVTINEMNDTLYRGETFQYTATYLPENTTDDDKTIVWNSSDETVATVDQNGKVTALKEGTTNITATVGNVVSDARVLNVKEAHLNSITLLQQENDVLYVGGEIPIWIILNPENCTDNLKFEWTSSDENIATVDEYGNVKGISSGVVTITAKVITEYGNEVISTIDINIPSSEVQTPDVANNSNEASSPKTGDMPIIDIVIVAVIAIITLLATTFVSNKKMIKQK